MKIMIVEDAAFMRMMLRNLLVKAGYECSEAANGREALSLYPQVRPDLVTLDITLPGLDGMGTLAALKRLAPDARVIMCSALGQESLVLEAIAAGASDFVVKPFQPERVLSAIAKVLAAPHGSTA